MIHNNLPNQNGPRPDGPDLRGAELPADEDPRAPDDAPHSTAADDAGDDRPEPATLRSSTARDPLHGVKLETMLLRLVDRHGWEEMGYRIPIRCFLFEPSVKSSLAFLRRTPWARKKVEDWYAYDARRFPMGEN